MTTSAPTKLKLMRFLVDTRGTESGGEIPRITVASVAGSWIEGADLQFTVRRLDETNGVCSVAWTVTSSGSAGNGDDFPFLHAAAPPPGAWVSPSLTDTDYTQVVLPTLVQGQNLVVAGQADRCYDGRDKTYFSNAGYRFPFQIKPWPGGGVLTGARFRGAQARTLTWRQMKTNEGGHASVDADGVRTEHTGPVIIEGCWFDNIMDPINPRLGGAFSPAVSCTVRHNYARYVRDDFYENDDCLTSVVEDNLIDGCFMFISKRPGDAAQGRCPTTLTTTNVRRNLVRFERMPYQLNKPWQHQKPFKQPFANGGPWHVHDNIFVIPSPPVDSNDNPAGTIDFPPTSEGSTYSNNIICWTGRSEFGDFPGNPPAGWTIVETTTAFDNARLAWLAAHGSGGADFAGPTTGTVDFADNQESVALSIPTRALAGAQGTRNVALTLSVPVDCVIDPSAGVATTTIIDAGAALDTIKATAAYASRVEGNDCIFTATREGALANTCSIGWNATSDGGPADLTGVITGTIEWTAGQSAKNITISTVRRAGDQNTRAVRFVLKTPSNCTIKTGEGAAATNLTDYVNPGGDSPLVGVARARTNVNEGSSAAFNVNRSRNIRGAATVHWNIASSGGAADWDGDHSGDVTVPDNVLTVAVSAQTAARSGGQGDRTLTCTLSNIVGGQIDDTNNPATCTLKDYTAPVGKWWKTQLGTLRCGRDWAGGPCYWNDKWVPYETQVAYITAFCGHNRLNGNNLSTWEKVFGGPTNNDHEIQVAGTQFGWASGNTHWTSMFAGSGDPPGPVTPNKAWCVFEFDMAPPDERTATGYKNGWRLNNKTIEDYNDGKHDAALIQCGKRIKHRFEWRGIDLNLFVGRMFHEMNGDWDYSITANTKTDYVKMLRRIYSKLREGADHYLHFAHCPVKKRVTTSDNSDLGAYSSWVPWAASPNDSGNVDVLAMSLHPDKGVEDATGWNKTLNGGGTGINAWYGLNTDQLEFAELHDLALGAFEWSPKFENNKIANTIYQWAYDDFFYPNRARMLGDCVYHPNTLNVTAADNQEEQTATGKANWELGVAKFKNLWGGTKPT